MIKKEELPECPVAITAQLIGNKWKLLILRNLRMRRGVLTNCKNLWRGLARKC